MDALPKAGNNVRETIRRLQAIDAEFRTAYIGDATIDTATITDATINDANLTDITVSGTSTLTDVIIEADIVSSNWDGASNDLGSGPVAASTGYLLDYDEGAAQFENIYAVGGELDTLSITGSITMEGTAVFTTGDGSSDPYFEFDNTAFGDRMRMHSTMSSQKNPGYLQIYEWDLGTYEFIGTALRSPEQGGVTNYAFGEWGSTTSDQSGNENVSVNSLGYALGNYDATSILQGQAVDGKGTAWVLAGATGTGDAEAILSAITNSGDADVTISASSTSGASAVTLLADSVVIDTGTPQYNFTAGSKAEFQLDNNGTQFDGVVRLTQESSGNSIYGFYNGSWQTHQILAENNMYWYTAGTRRMSLSTSNLVVGNLTTGAPQMPFAAGSVGAPTYSFYGDNDTGIYRQAANYLGIAAGGNLIANFGYSSPNKEIYFYGVPSTGSYNTMRISTSTGRIYYLSSGRKYKEQITDADLASVQLRPRRYWRNDDKEWQYGFVADELAEVLPEAITQYDKDGEPDNYDDRAIIAVLADKVNKLEKRVEGLECQTY